MEHTHVCPVSHAYALNNFLRRLIHPPAKILQPFVNEGQTVLDVGCGPGHFSIAMAKLVGPTGRVIAADLQQGMLEHVKKHAIGKKVLERITLHACQQNRIALEERVDFALAFYMVHEHPHPQALIEELTDIVKPGGSFLLVEPKFHVSSEDFDSILDFTRQAGFFPKAVPRIRMSRAVLFRLPK